MAEQQRQQQIVSIAARARLRREIDEQIQQFLEQGGHIEILQRRTAPQVPRASSWEIRGMGPDAVI